MPKQTPLGAACELRLLTFNQAASVSRHWEIYCAYLRKESDVGDKDELDLAAELGWIDSSKIPEIRAEWQRMRAKGEDFPDFEKQSLWGRGQRGTIWLPVVKIVSVVSLTVAVASAIWTRVDIFVISSVLGALAVVTTAIVELVGRESTIPIRFARFGAALVGGTAAFAVAFCVYQGHHLSNVAAGGASVLLIDVSFVRFLLGMGFIAACLVTYLFWLRLRRHTIVLQLMRSLMVRTIVAECLAARSQTHGVRNDGADPISPLRSILEHVAEMLDCNPWARRAAWFFRFVRWREAGALSVWYLEPNDEGKRFDVLEYVTINVPSDAEGVFRSIKERHHPIVMDEGRYEKLRDDAKAEAKQLEDELSRRAWIVQKTSKRISWRTIMKRQMDRHEFVSLTGYVFGKKIPLPSQRAEECAVFDRHFRNAVDAQFRKRAYEKWIDFRSFLAFPILSKDPDQKPLGVLVAFRNFPNGFALNDLDTLETVARVLGMALDGDQSILTSGSSSTQDVLRGRMNGQHAGDAVDSVEPVTEE